jgi:uncharacterized lipoprotein YajG
MRNAKVFQLVLLIIVAGCTTQPGKDHVANNANAARPDVQCHSEQLTGSMLSRTVCSTQDQRDAQQAATTGLKTAVGAGNAVCVNGSAAGCH